MVVVDGDGGSYKCRSDRVAFYYFIYKTVSHYKMEARYKLGGICLCAAVGVVYGKRVLPVA